MRYRHPKGLPRPLSTVPGAATPTSAFHPEFIALCSHAAARGSGGERKTLGTELYGSVGYPTKEYKEDSEGPELLEGRVVYHVEHYPQRADVGPLRLARGEGA